jgi:hypothetical protein
MRSSYSRAMRLTPITLFIPMAIIGYLYLHECYLLVLHFSLFYLVYWQGAMNPN